MYLEQIYVVFIEYLELLKISEFSKTNVSYLIQRLEKQKSLISTTRSEIKSWDHEYYMKVSEEQEALIDNNNLKRLKVPLSKSQIETILTFFE